MLKSLKKSKKKLMTSIKGLKRSVESSIGSECDNTFLLEITENSDIDSCVRTEIEQKYQNSKVNTKYRFPRSKPSSVKKKKPGKSLVHTKSKSLFQKVPMPKIKKLSLSKAKVETAALRNTIRTPTPASTIKLFSQRLCKKVPSKKLSKTHKYTQSLHNLFTNRISK